MLAARLVRLIESHSEQLSSSLLEKFRTSPKCHHLIKVPDEELKERSYEIYKNLSDWLLNSTDGEIELRYVELGRRRAEQGVAFSHFLWAITLTKEHLFQFLQREGFADTAIELHGHLELLRLLNQFFDRALYFAAIGYERAGVAIAA